MKTIITILLLLPALSLNAAELVLTDDAESSVDVLLSNDQATAIRFTMPGLITEEVNYQGNVFMTVDPFNAKAGDFGSTGETGKPELPLWSSGVIIPDQSGVRVNIISAEYQVISDIDIAPVQPLQIEGQDDPIPFAIDSDVYGTDGFYPGELVTIGEPEIFKDFRTLDVTVCPLQYNPVTKELRVYTNIEYELIYEGYDGRNVKTRDDNHISEAFLPLYREYLLNANEVLASFEPKRGGYLIITAYSCTTAARQLAEWKHRKGFETEIISTNDLGGNPTYTQVKNAIQQVYNESDPGLEYVAIIGDMDGAAGFKVACYTYSGDVSDYHYALLDGNDSEADVIVSRLSVRTVTNMNTVIAKTLKYEQEPFMEDSLYYNRGLAVGGPYGSSSPRMMALWVRQTMLDHGYIRADTVIDNTGNPYYTN